MSIDQKVLKNVFFHTGSVLIFSFYMPQFDDSFCLEFVASWLFGQLACHKITNQLSVNSVLNIIACNCRSFGILSLAWRSCLVLHQPGSCGSGLNDVTHTHGWKELNPCLDFINIKFVESRYSTFLLLYPTGITSEVGLIYIALPYIKVNNSMVHNSLYVNFCFLMELYFSWLDIFYITVRLSCWYLGRAQSGYLKGLS